MALTFISLILDSGVVSPGSGAFPYFVAAQNGLSSALCVSLLINGFVGFQLYEDGTTLSVWLLRLCSVGMFVLTGAISLLTFKGWAGLSPTKTIGLFVILYLFNGIFLLVYLIMQILLVTNTLQDRWPIGDIIFGLLFRHWPGYSLRSGEQHLRGSGSLSRWSFLRHYLQPPRSHDDLQGNTPLPSLGIST